MGDAAPFTFLDPARQRHAVPDWATLDGLVIPGDRSGEPTPVRAKLAPRVALAAAASVPVLLAAKGAFACLLP